MEYTTVEYLEEMTAHKRYKHKVFSFFKEIKVLGFIFILVTMGMIVFTNAKLFATKISKDIHTPDIKQELITQDNMYQDNSIAFVIEDSDQKNDEIQKILDQYKQEGLHSTPLAQLTQDQLGERIKTYDFKFNTLPPTNRLLVPSLGVNDPIVTSKYIDIKDFTNGNFDEELKNGVVKYPTTPDPGQYGASLIFGHTSQERWKYNHYGMTFAHIADLKIGEMLQVVRNGALYEYKIIDVQVKYPQHVNETYMQYQNLGLSEKNSYLVLMGCYPIGTAKQRMLVIGELVTLSK